MVEKLAATESATATGAIAKQSLILGMPTSHAIALGAGIVVGLAACYVGYKYITKKNVTVKKSTKYISDLISRQEVVDTFTAKDMADWFEANKAQFDPKSKRVVATPTEEMIKGLGFEINESYEPQKHIIQFFFDDSTNKVLKLRFVSFKNIESNLQAHLLDNDGMIVVTD